MQGCGSNCFGHIFSMVLICVLAPGTLRAMNLQSIAACGALPGQVPKVGEVSVAHLNFASHLHPKSRVDRFYDPRD